MVLPPDTRQTLRFFKLDGMLTDRDIVGTIKNERWRSCVFIMFGKIFRIALIAWAIAVNVSYGALNENFSYEEMIEHKNYFQKCVQYDIPGDEFLTRTESFIAGNRELKAELNELEKYTLLLTIGKW